jgi:purine-binding chemotaxis protein CheW
MTNDVRSYVTLGLEQEIFAVEVEYVREILDFRTPSQLPNAPPYLMGMIDVRGATIPVIDLRVRLGLAPVAATPQTRILVLEAECGGRPLLMGLLADRVFEVAELSAGDIEPAPDIGIRWKSEYIKGVSRVRGAFVVIFDLARLFASDEAVLLDAAS